MVIKVRAPDVQKAVDLKAVADGRACGLADMIIVALRDLDDRINGCLRQGQVDLRNGNNFKLEQRVIFLSCLM